MDLDLLKKFESKTNRVKGLAFHPHRPWLLVSLHNGVISLYDYRMEILLYSFEEHEGPVRGVHFHHSNPLFVSGGDDYKVKVWNYQLKRCLYTLHGHLDYIRTVYFHPSDHPWILSASDDQTVRIWNWQSRQCLLVLTGHNHYVMCAKWHPSEDLILSASLDQTIRIWDISGLTKKSRAIPGDIPSISSSFGTSGGSGNNKDSVDMFGNVDAVVKFVLEGHSRGVNWASFHPTMNLVVSGADDREIKVWRMSGSRAWETTTYRGHLNNVSSVLFYPKENVIVSNSEDKTLRVWDVQRNHAPLTFRRDNDRYWILTAHPRLNLLASGHDNGFLIFKLSRERPAYYTTKDNIYYCSEGYIRMYNCNTSQDTPIVQTRQGMSNTSYGTSNNKRLKKPRRLLFNDFASTKEQNIILFYDNSFNNNTFGDSVKSTNTQPTSNISEFELYVIDKKGNLVSSENSTQCISVAFVTRNRLAVLDYKGDISLKDMKDVTKRKINIPERSINYIFCGGPGRILLRSQEWISMFDIASKKIIKEIQIPTRFPIKFVNWSKGYNKVALLAKFSVMICDKNLNDICTIYENAKVKSGSWNKNGDVFIYTTVTHMKYALPSGDHGIIKTLDEVLYVSHINKNNVTCITRENSTIKNIKIDNTEYIFKKALTEKRFGEVQKLIENGKLKGESIIAYLQKKGFPEVALNFVTDFPTKFELALECGNISDAFECAKNINTKETWNRFGKAALMQGNYRFVTEAYKQTLNFEKLMYLSCLIGNYNTLNKLNDIAKSKDDKSLIFNISMLTNNVNDKITTLEKTNQLPLAYLTAISHGLIDKANEIKDKLNLNNKKELAKLRQNNDDNDDSDDDKDDDEVNIILPDNLPNNPSQLIPPNPIFGPFEANEQMNYDWPKLEIPDSRELFHDSKNEIENNNENNNERNNNNDNILYDTDDDNDNNKNKFMDDIDEFEPIKPNDDDSEAEIENYNKKSRTNKNKSSNNAIMIDDDDDDGSWLSDDAADEKDPNNNNNNNIDEFESKSNLKDKFFMLPASGSSPSKKWSESSANISDMIASGLFDIAQGKLHRQFAIVNFKPLKTYFMNIYTSSHSYLNLMPNCSDISVGLRKNPDKKNEYLPHISLSIQHLNDYLKNGLELTTQGNFEEAIIQFRKILHIIPLIDIINNNELKEIKQLISTSSEYINALRCKLLANKEKDNKNDKGQRFFELLCYFTHYKIQDGHLFGALYTAMKQGYKTGNFKTTQFICQRLLELAVSGSISSSDNSQKYIKQAQKVLQKCQQKGNDSMNLEYKANNFNTLCGISFKPISINESYVKSPYCNTIFKKEYNAQLSPVCQLVKIGSNADGVIITK